MRWHYLILLLLLPLKFAHAAPDYLTVTWENDIFAGKDGGYTNGLAVSWAYAGFNEFTTDNTPEWIHTLTKNLPIATTENKQRAIGYSVAQAMQTPSDLSQRALQKDEAPYAGLIVWRANLFAYDTQHVDRLGFALGFVGPVSGAKFSQRIIHKATGSTKPMGWDNQLKNEMVFQVSMMRMWRLVARDNRAVGFDIVGLTGGAIGTLKSDVTTGLSLRFGHDLASNYATASINPGREINPLAGDNTDWHIFFNISASAVANDILINGNTFEDSHSVPLQHLQAQFVTGTSFNIANWAFLFSAVIGTEQYKHQAPHPRYGSLSVTYNF